MRKQSFHEKINSLISNPGCATLFIAFAILLALVILINLSSCQNTTAKPDSIGNDMANIKIKRIANALPDGIYEVTYDRHTYIIVDDGRGVAITPVCNMAHH